MHMRPKEKVMHEHLRNTRIHLLLIELLMSNSVYNRIYNYSSLNQIS